MGFLAQLPWGLAALESDAPGGYNPPMSLMARGYSRPRWNGVSSERRVFIALPIFVVYWTNLVMSEENVRMNVKKLMFLVSYVLAMMVLGHQNTTFERAGFADTVAANETPPGPNW